MRDVQTLVLFYVTNATVSGIRLLNAKFFHINIDTSKDITVKDVSITAPADVENTDGVHVGASSKVTISTRPSAPATTASPSAPGPRA